nr:MAG TPA: hypothetical protein [Crassvirales sp.]
MLVLNNIKNIFIFMIFRIPFSIFSFFHILLI